MSTADANQVRPLYLNGRWSEPTNPLTVRNPATGEVVGRVATVDRAGVAQALATRKKAFPAWRSLPPRDRGVHLTKLADALERRAAEIAKTITLENGKPLAQSRGELGMSVDHLRWFAGEAGRAYGRVVPNQVPGKRHIVLRVPVGVVAAISPWNFPLVLALRKVAPALAAGCPVILKPASATPLCALQFAEICEEVGLPAGVFQVVAGRASEIAAEFLENPLCAKITFTGFTEVGQSLVQGAAKRLTKLSLELGGHSPVLVFDDADLDQAIQGTLITKFRNTGQSCIASNRVDAQRSIFDEFMKRLVAKVQAMKVGNGFDDGVEIGPLIDQKALEHALHYIQDAVAGGAKILCGGQRWSGDPRGNFLEPTVLVNVPPTALCMQDEIFAPVVPVCAFDDEAEAVREANNTRYGLAAYAFTRDISRMWRLAEALEAGMIGINDSVPTTSQCPFGGVKQSGWGRELGSEGLDAFLETRHVSMGVQA